MRKQEFDQFLKFVEGMGVEPLEAFDWKRPSSEKFTMILKLEPRLSFRCVSEVNTFTGFIVSWTKYEKTFSQHLETTGVSIKGVCGHFEKWYNTHVKEFLKEYHFPDPFEELKKRAKMKFDFGPDSTESEQYTETEKTVIRSKLSEFKVEILKTIQLTEEGKAHVEKEFKYIESQPDQLDKRQFKALFKDFVYDLSVSISANVVVEVGTAVVAMNINSVFWGIVKKVFGALLQLNG